MKQIWQMEKTAIFITVTTILVLGYFFENWIVALLLPLTTYIIWMYSRLFRLEKWLARGTKSSEVYDDHGYVDLIIRHLYQQRKAYSKRKKRIKQLLNRLNTNISALPDATVLLNQNFEIEWSNQPAAYLLGISRDDIGQRIDNLIRNPIFHKYLRKPEKRQHLELESPLAKDITLHIKVVRFGSNQRLIIIRNVSDQKQLQAALKNFVANASHELQTPLTTIMGHLEMLEMQDELPESAQHSISVAQHQSLRMKSIIQDLLLLSKLESHRLNMDEGKPIDIHLMMTSVFKTLNRTCDDGNIVCEIPQGFRMLGEVKEIEGLCINLIENALKHTPMDTKITICWSENSNHEYVFAVTDQGQGIPEKDLPYLTDRYYRVQNARKENISGSGLGLAIVQQAATKHGAKLEIKSQLNQGSTFSVTFPGYRVIDGSS